METNTSISEITSTLKDNLPSQETLARFVKENEQILSIAGGAFLAVFGLKFFSKTIGFLTFAGGVTLLYKGATQYPQVREALNKLATPSPERVKSEALISVE